MIKNKVSIDSDNHKLTGLFWQAENPVAMVVLVHGFGEHISRYDHVAQHLLNKKISVLGVDLIGHGNSSGKRGHISSIEDFFGCVDSMVSHIKSNDGTLPLVLYGHSMGGNIVLNYQIAYPDNIFCCTVSTSPWLKLSIQPTALQLFLARTMNKIYPSLQQSGDLDVKDISSVVEVQQDYTNDTLNHNKISVRLFNEIFKNGLLAIDNAALIKTPVLVAHGDDDHITSAKASEAFAANCPLATYKAWPGLRHETHNEFNKDEVINFYVDWVLGQLPQ